MRNRFLETVTSFTPQKTMFYSTVILGLVKRNLFYFLQFMSQYKMDLCTVCYIMSDGGITKGPGYGSIGLVEKTGLRIRNPRDRSVWNKVVVRRLAVVLIVGILRRIVGTNVVYAFHFSHVHFVHYRLWNGR